MKSIPSYKETIELFFKHLVFATPLTHFVKIKVTSDFGVGKF
jgi:hypothetical protein